MLNSIMRVSVLVMVFFIAAPGAFAQAWPDVFNPFQILTLNLQLAEPDWDTIRHDTTNEIEVPASFWADGESPFSFPCDESRRAHFLQKPIRLRLV